MSEVLQFPGKPRPPAQRPDRRQAENIRALVDILKRAKPRRGSKPTDRLIKARDNLVAFAEKCAAMGKYGPMEMVDVMLALVPAIVAIEMEIEAGKRSAG
jgi:hypothetical protein